MFEDNLIYDNVHSKKRDKLYLKKGKFYLTNLL